MPDRKTQKKKSPGQKYKYPPEFLTKSGTIKKNMRKQAMEFRKTHNQDGTPLLSRSVSHSELEPEPEGRPVSPGARYLGPAPEEDTSDEAFMNRHRPLEELERRDYLVDERATRRYGDMPPPHPNSVEAMRRARISQFNDMPPPHPNSVEAMRRARRSHLDEDQLEFLRGIDESGSVEDVGELPYLPDDLIRRLLDEIVFKNEPRGPMNPERCRNLSKFCQLYPRTCAFNEDFKREFVYPCSENISSYREYLDFMEAIPELRRDSKRYINPYLYPNVKRHQHRRYGSPYDNQNLNPSRYVKAYLTSTDLNRRSRKLGIMGKRASDVIFDILSGSRYSRVTWEQLRQYIYKNPKELDFIMSNIKKKLQELEKPNGEPRYTERTIDRIIKRFIEEFYD
jgi:hypothetical protein